MKSLVEKYKTWFQKEVKTLECSKGNEGNLLLNRFQSLELLNEDVLGVHTHILTLHRIVSEFLEERQNLRWLQKLAWECEHWKKLFEATARTTKVEENDVIRALVEDEIDMDLAIGLM